MTSSSPDDSSVASPEVRRGSWREIPGPRRHPLFGYRGQMLSFLRNFPAHMTAVHRAYGPISCLVKGGNPSLFFKPLPDPVPTLFAFGPEANRTVLMNPRIFGTRPLRGPAQVSEVTSSNMSLAGVELHGKHRRLTMPAFTRNHLKAYYNDIERYTRNMLDRWQIGETIDICAEAQQLTVETAIKTLYGIEPTEENQHFARAVCEMVERQFSFASMIPIPLPGTPYSKLIRVSEEVVGILREIIETKRSSSDLGDDVLSLMIRARDEDGTMFTSEQLLGNAFLMVFANLTTVWAVLAVILIFLAQHPEVMAALVEELESRLDGGPPKYEDLHSLPVLDRVIKESMRIISPGIVTPRVALEATELGGYEVPAGSEVLISAYVTHRDPALYTEPRTFHPDRWLEIDPPPFEYLPYGQGIHKCLGAGFGAMQLRMMLSMILQKFRLEMIPRTKIDFSFRITMKPERGVPMIVRPQDHNFSASRCDLEGYIREVVDLD